MWRWVLSGAVYLCAVAADLTQAGAHTADRAYMFDAHIRGQAPIQLYVEETGRGQPMLLLHGFAASTYTWKNIVPALSRRYRVIALDLKGFGKSQKPFDRAYRPEDQANLVADFIVRRGLRDVILTGHSYGGMVGLLATMKLNARKQQRVKRMVLMNAPAFPQAMTRFLKFMHLPVLPYALLSVVPPELATWVVLDPMQRETATLKDVRTHAAPYYSAAARHALISTARQIVPGNVATIVRLYPRVPQKTLVVWCDNDVTVPLHTGKKLARALANARLSVIKDCEHVPQDEQPKELLRVMRRFLRG